MKYHLTPVITPSELPSKRTQINVGEDIEKRKHLHTVGGNVNWCSHCEKQYGGLKKLKTDPEIPLLGVYT